MKEKKKLRCPVVSQICALWPWRFHQEFSIFSLMQPKCPDIFSFAHFDEFFFQFFFRCNPYAQMVTIQPPPVTRQPPSVTLHIF